MPATFGRSVRVRNEAGRAPSDDLLAELYELYGKRPAQRRLRMLYKRFTWAAVIGGAKLIKRTLDAAVALLMLLTLSPLFTIVAAAIKLTDGGPVLFWQARVGRWGAEFRFPKFRSMVVNAEALKEGLMTLNDHSEGVTFKMKNDPRITWIGRIIRKFSIDELPQLWCVLRGEMSLVGPRPPVPKEVAKYTIADRRRLDVIPGLTCIWQVSGRSEIAFAQQVELDVRYIQSQSVLLDLILLAKTVPAVLRGRGAY